MRDANKTWKASVLSNMSILFRKAFADEPEQGNNSEQANGQSEGKASEPDASASSTAGNTAPDYNLMKDSKVAVLVQSARSEEKAKLHTEIEGLKSQLAAKATEATTLATKVGELTANIANLNGEITRLQDESTLNGDEKLKTLQAASLEKDKAISKLTGEIEQASIKYNMLQLDTYKSNAIAKANGKIIAEMVTGATMEAIDASVVLATELFAKYNPEAGESAEQKENPAEQNGNPAGQSNGNVPDINPFRADGAQHVELSSMNVMRSATDAKKYAEHRAQLGMS